MTARIAESSDVPSPAAERPVRPALDPALVALARARDPRALSLIVDDLRPDLVKVACALLRRSPGHPDVEDLVSECNVRLLGAIGTRYDPGQGPLPAYAKGFARNVARRTFAGDAVHRHLKDQIQPVLAERAATDPGWQRVVARLWLEKALHVLTGSQLSALWAKHVEDLSHAEIAVLLGRSEKAVNSLLGHGRTRVRRFAEREQQACAA